MKNIITLPNGARVSVGAYAKAWKALKAMPADRLVGGFGHFPMRAADILFHIKAGLHDRINRHFPSDEYWRIKEADTFFNVMRFARDVNSRTLIRASSVRGLPWRIVKRVAHRITKDNEI